ncbi:WXG100 family type VII secretion target, partial [Paractinoplanes hotanensis]
MPIDNRLDYQAYVDQPGGWRLLRSAVVGGAALATDAGKAYAASLVSPQSLADTGAAFDRAQQALTWIERVLREHSQAVAGEGKPWQGPAAEAFLQKMTDIADNVRSHAEAIKGSPATGISYNVPEQMYRAGNALAYAQRNVKYWDSAYATLARMSGAPVGKDGLVAITGGAYEKPMARMMAYEIDQLVKVYDEIKVAEFQQPPGADPSNVPSPPPPSVPPPPPPSEVPPPSSVPPPSEVPPPSSVPPPSEVPPPSPVPPPSGAAPPPPGGVPGLGGGGTGGGGNLPPPGGVPNLGGPGGNGPLNLGRVPPPGGVPNLDIPDGNGLSPADLPAPPPPGGFPGGVPGGVPLVPAPAGGPPRTGTGGNSAVPSPVRPPAPPPVDLPNRPGTGLTPPAGLDRPVAGGPLPAPRPPALPTGPGAGSIGTGVNVPGLPGGVPGVSTPGANLPGLPGGVPGVSTPGANLPGLPGGVPGVSTPGA